MNNAFALQNFTSPMSQKTVVRSDKCHEPTYPVQQKPLLDDLVGAAVAWRAVARAQQSAETSARMEQVQKLVT